MKKITIIIIGMLLLNLALVNASIGVGISPSKIFDVLESKERRNYTFIIYNTGNIDVKARMSLTDDIEKWDVKFYPEEFILKPEPEPHRLPPANGQTVTVSLKSPVSKAKKFTGHVVASAGPSDGSSFGGSGAVASRIELEILPPKHFWDYWTKKQVITGSAVTTLVLLMLIGLFIMKKKGLRLGLVRNN